MHPLNGDDITRGYSAPDIQLAIRNAAVLRWLNALDSRPTVAKLVQREYAAWSGLPHDEVIGALAYITDQPSLDWIYARYGKDIRALENQSL